METASENLANALGCELAAEVTHRFGRVYLRARGISMVPAICPGDLICVEDVSASEVEVGEIVAFAREDCLIAHRVMAKDSDEVQVTLVTRGDRLRRDDVPISSSELIGRVYYIERRGAGHFTPRRASFWHRALAHLLCFSERATYLYLRLAVLWPMAPARAEGQLSFRFGRVED